MKDLANCFRYIEKGKPRMSYDIIGSNVCGKKNMNFMRR